jgi:HAD superfamily hydrolase (TIGR01549 family)
MDGTLTVPVLDFDAIRADLGVKGPILEAIENMSPQDQHVAREKLLGHERRAAQRSQLNPGCVELLQWARSEKLKLALVTRNTPESVATVISKFGLEFDTLITRDDRPYKPMPDPALLACKRLGVSPADAWFIGDGNHDIECAVAADITSVWISHGEPRDFTAVPTAAVRDLWELLDLLRAIQTKSTVSNGTDV